jgi:hypothetical protein
VEEKVADRVPEGERALPQLLVGKGLDQSAHLPSDLIVFPGQGF